MISKGRQREIVGLILIVLALLVALALVTYSEADELITRSLRWQDIFAPAEIQASNALGIVGAFIARTLVRDLLGYPTLLFTVLLFGVGYTLLRQRSTQRLFSLSILVLALTFGLGALAGWLGLVFDLESIRWSGRVGLGSAGWLQHAFGVPGSVILLLLVIIAPLLLLVDYDLQRIMDRCSMAITSVRSRLKRRIRPPKDHRKTRPVISGKSPEPGPPGSNLPEASGSPPDAAGLQGMGGSSTSPQGMDASSAEAGSQGMDSPLHAPGSWAADAKGPSPWGTDAKGSSPWETDAKGSSPSAQADADYPTRSVGPERPSGPGGPSPSRKTDAGHPMRSAGPEPPPGSTPTWHVQKRLDEESGDPTGRQTGLSAGYRFPGIDLLDARDAGRMPVDYAELEGKKQILLDKLQTYNIGISAINAIVGPTVTLYELTPAPGVKISRITALEHDLAMAMEAGGIRIIAPIPGKPAVGVEIPNRRREFVRIRDVIGTARFRDADMELPIPIGKTIEGEVFIRDLTKLPHLLIAGATGSGKSVGLNALIVSLLYACDPAKLKFVMIDPKKIELPQYKHIADHFVAMPENAKDPIITDFNEALAVLKSCEREMEMRYDLLADAEVRSLREYNRKLEKGSLKAEDGFGPLPYVVVVVDELADLMMTAGKDIEGPIARLAQMARAVGLHLVLATQRPSVDVITGLIKANFPARIAYQVASKVDSRTILDQNGAEGLVGNGDMLYMLGSKIARLQGPFVSDGEVERIVEFVADQRGAGPYLLPPCKGTEDADEPTGLGDIDPLFEEAARIIVRSKQGSVSLLQRKLSIGYTRAARIVDQLEGAGVVGRFAGSKAREVLVETEEELDALLMNRANPAGFRSRS